jgi:hypothetical protein
MPVRTLIFLILFTPLHALAMSCWMTSGADINFGNMVAGEAVSASTKVKFSCQADYGTTQYVNVCLSSTDTPPFQMMSVGDDQESNTPCCSGYSAPPTVRRNLACPPAAT